MAPHFATASQSTVRKKLESTQSFERAELLGSFVPASRLAYIRADALETEIGKHNRVLAGALRQGRGRTARFCRTLEYEPGRDQIASRSKLLALFYEALDVLGIEPADDVAGRRPLGATLTRRQHRRRLALARCLTLGRGRP